ncbi:MAG: Maf family protein [Acidimicrobiia bacterium]|nr:Maf family protein [Acidimicrobiia bacterium]
MAQEQQQFVLASGSPRRRLLLTAAGYRFDVISPDIDESRTKGERAEEYVVRMAQEKADAVAERVPTGTILLGFDTAVVLADRILGKPADEAEATAMLLSLAGRTHTVYTGYSLVRAGEGFAASGVDASRVTMRPVNPAEAAEYAATGEPLDKAGAYALQGRGREFVSKVEGAKSTVIGLPLEHVVDALTRSGVLPVHDGAI